MLPSSRLALVGVMLLAYGDCQQAFNPCAYGNCQHDVYGRPGDQYKPTLTYNGCMHGNCDSNQWAPGAPEPYTPGGQAFSAFRNHPSGQGQYYRRDLGGGNSIWHQDINGR